MSTPEKPTPWKDQAHPLAKLLGRVPEPEAPSAMQERVWRQLRRAGAPRRPRTAIWAGAAATCALAAIVLFSLKGEGPARLRAVSGAVQRLEAGGEIAQAQARDPLRAGEAIRTGAGGRAELTHARWSATLGEQAELALAADGALQLVRGDLSLRGELSLESAGYRVDVATGRTAALAITAEPFALRVFEGEVHLSGKDARLWLSAGERWPLESAAGTEVQPATALAPVQQGNAPASVHPERSRGASAVADRASLDFARDERVAQRPEEPSAQVQVPSVHPERSRGASAVADRASLDFARDERGARDERALAARNAREQPPSPAPLLAATPAAGGYERAAALAKSGATAEALAAYQDVASRSGRQAELALYEAGRLQLTRLGQPAAAAQTFRRHRALYPAGLLQAESTLSLIEALLASGDRDAAAAEIDAALSGPLAKERGSELGLLRAHLLRDRQRWAEAKAAYAALSGEAGRVGDEATFHVAICEQHLGQDGAARTALEAYLGRFPQGRHREEALRALR